MCDVRLEMEMEMEMGVNWVKVESENQCVKKEAVTNDMGKMERLIKLSFFTRLLENIQ